MTKESTESTALIPAENEQMQHGDRNEANSCTSEEVENYVCAAGTCLFITSLVSGAGLLWSGYASSCCLPSVLTPPGSCCPTITCAEMVNPCLVAYPAKTISFDLMWGGMTLFGAAGGGLAARSVYNSRTQDRRVAHSDRPVVPVMKL